ncbi:PLDc N-terminal domain-containing protein [Candidatus Dojkabacteria bacterium]|nr:PLDc N-terminal domain-containing protein [Candidatus Dojkabacteria bacterium]
MYESSSDAASGAFAAVFGLGMASFWVVWMCIYCVGIILGIAGMVLWLVMLIDLAKREDQNFPDKGENQKTLWLLIVILGGAIGALVYYFLVYKKAKNG